MQAPIKDEAEFEELLAFTLTRERPAMYRLMVLLSIRVGLRPMEIAGMDSSWVRGEMLRIPVGHAKGKKGRSLPWTIELQRALLDHMGNRGGRVFLNRVHEPFTGAGISEAMRRLYREAGQLGSCYSGRRTMATNMIDRGVSVFVVQKALGHSSVQTTMNYVSVTESMLRRGMFA